MAYIDNSETKKELDEAIRGNAQTNLSPSNVAGQVIPVININPKHSRRCNITRATSATGSSGTIYTAPTDKDFFIVACSLSVCKDVTATSTNSDINVTIDGATNPILSIAGLTLTAQSESVSLCFNSPIKIDRGTSVTISNTTNVANIRTRGTITGYTTEA